MLRQIDCFSSYGISYCDGCSPVCIDILLNSIDSIRQPFRLSDTFRPDFLPMESDGLLFHSSITDPALQAKFLHYRLKRIAENIGKCNRVSSRIAMPIPQGQDAAAKSGKRTGEVDSTNNRPFLAVSFGKSLETPKLSGELLLEGVQ